MMKKLERGRAALRDEGGYEALQSMLKGEYTEESTGARTIRQTGGKDRHSKVFTARGPRDRRVRLSVATAIRFYDLQDRLGFEQPSKAVEWLLLHCQPSIQALPQLASLHPMRVATIPQPAYIDHHSHDHKEQESCHDELSKHHHKDKKSYTDVVMPQNREHNFHHYNFTTAHHSSLHNSPFPLYTDSHVQDSIEEDPPQSSNPSSSGASSDQPMSISEAARPHCKATLVEAIPITANHTATSTTSMRQGSTSFTSPATFHMNKRHRMQNHLQNHDDHATFASNGTRAANMSMSAGRPLACINNGLSNSLNYSSFCNTANFNSLMINDENAVLINNSLQGQGNEDMQAIMRLPSLGYKANQCVDITQLLLANQLALNEAHHVIQGTSNQSNMREADINGQAAYTPNSSMNDTIQLYNKIALQQVDELVCSNMYASPSPSESTSINTLAAAYSKAGANNMQVDDQAANILYRPTWNPSSVL